LCPEQEGRDGKEQTGKVEGRPHEQLITYKRLVGDGEAIYFNEWIEITFT
jgi:hypothetical protein